MTPTQDNRRGAALFLLSAGITAHQLALMQILSYVQWSHFAYLVVSLALLGFGASGTIFALYRPRLSANCDRLLPGLMLGCALTFSLATIPFTTAPLRFDLYLLFVEPTQLLRLSGACLLYALPFLCGGLAIILALSAGVERSGFLYFANLSGSGGGALLGIGLTGLCRPEKLPGLIALLPMAAALLLIPRPGRGKFWVAAALTLGLCLLSLFKFPPLRPSQFKEVSQLLNLPQPQILAAISSPHGLLQIVAAPALRQAPGLSLNFQGEVPNSLALLVNGNSYGALSLPAKSAGPLLDSSPEFLGYLRGGRQSVLLLQPGGSNPVAQALAREVPAITVVEPHPQVHRLMGEGVGGFAGYAGNPAVTLVRDDPRAFLAAGRRTYDLIRFPPVGSLANNIGLLALSEQFLLTGEAFAEAWQRLTPEGVIMVSAWLDYPVKNPLKILATLVETAEGAGVTRPEQHLAAVRGWGSITFVLSRKPLSAQECQGIREECRRLGFDPLLLPELQPGERERFNLLQDQPFFANVERLMSPQGRRNLYRSYDFQITPATDNRPYFSQFLRPLHLLALGEILTLRQMPFFEMGSFILFATLLLLSGWAVVLIILPLFRLGWRGRQLKPTLFYFGGLGVGYMLIEIVLIQALTLMIGHPLVAAATVLGTLLFSAGLGSLYSERLRPRPPTIRWIVALICLLLLIYGWALNAAGTQLALLGGTPARVLGAILLIIPLGFSLGMPFPLGLKNLHSLQPELLPWAWGINGCLSVVGPALATVIGVQFGFRVVFWLAALAYLLVLGSVQEGSGGRNNDQRH